MNFFAQANAWVATNQTTVMVLFVAVFVAFHLVLLVNTLANVEETEATAVAGTDSDNEEVFAAYYAYHPMMF